MGQGAPERRSPLFTLATGSKFLFITAATSSVALKDYFQPCPLLRGVQPGCRSSSMPVVLSYGDVFRALAVIKRYMSPAPLPQSGICRGWSIVEDLKLRRGKIRQTRVAPSAVSSAIWIFITAVVCLSLSLSLFPSPFHLSLFNCFHQNATYFSDKHRIYENVRISAS